MKKRVLYIDFFLPILDYVSVLKLSEALYEWGIPLVMTVCLYSCGILKDGWNPGNFLNVIITTLAIIIGFSIAAIAILITADKEKNPVLLKESDRSILNKRISWFSFLYLNMVYSAFAAFFTLIIAFLVSFLSLTNSSITDRGIILYALIFGLLHTLFVNIRSLTSIYHIYLHPKSSE